MLKSLISGQPEMQSNFSFNSPLIPNWLSTLVLAAISEIVPDDLALRLTVLLIVIALVSSSITVLMLPLTVSANERKCATTCCCKFFVSSGFSCKCAFSPRAKIVAATCCPHNRSNDRS